jgi:hypothetical protein
VSTSIASPFKSGAAISAVLTLAVILASSTAAAARSAPRSICEGALSTAFAAVSAVS